MWVAQTGLDMFTSLCILSSECTWILAGGPVTCEGLGPLLPPTSLDKTLHCSPVPMELEKESQTAEIFGQDKDPCVDTTHVGVRTFLSSAS